MPKLKPLFDPPSQQQTWDLILAAEKDFKRTGDDTSATLVNALLWLTGYSALIPTPDDDAINMAYLG